MSFPIQSLVTDLREIGYVVGALVGFGFGFVLERAGFGRAPKLAAQFYLYDMTVFKVMFGAIVTAMLGVLVASGVGLVDLEALSEGAVSGTFVWPMLFGGLLLGVGFIVSGYCPGTSLVGAGSGNIDGMVALAGIFVGSLLYGEMFPLVESFHTSGAQGQVFLYELLPLSPVAVGIAVTAMAVGGFIGAEKVEKFMTARLSVAASIVDDSRDAPAPRRLVFGIYGVVAVATLVTLFFPVRTEAEAALRVAAPIDSAELAARVLEEPWQVRVIDVREQSKCTEERVVTAECVPAADLDEIGLAYSVGERTLVIVGDADMKHVPAPALAYRGELRMLAGGHAAWKTYALTEPPVPAAGADTEVLAAYRQRAALVGALTGAAAPPPAPAGAVPAFVPKKKKKGGGCN